MTAASILVVDDEPQIRRVLRATLSAQGYAILEARNGAEAVEIMHGERPDLVLLDMNMPAMDGLETCRAIRVDSEVPIIMLTVRGAEKDKVQALDAGADDYVVKPFGMAELLARIRAALRRAETDETSLTVSARELNIDLGKRHVEVRGKALHLTPKEFDVLRELVAHHGRPVAHRRLLQTVWGPEYGGEIEYLRVVVNQLRKKIEAEPTKPKLIRTEPWIGYRFVLPKDARVEGGNRENK